MLDSTLSTIESKVDECRDLLEQLVESVIGSDIHDELTGLEYSKVFATIAFTFCSLRYVQEKLNGHNPANHPVSRDLVRVKEYMQEINDIMLREKRPRINLTAARKIVRSTTQRFESGDVLSKNQVT